MQVDIEKNAFIIKSSSPKPANKKIFLLGLIVFGVAFGLIGVNLPQHSDSLSNEMSLMQVEQPVGDIK